MAPAQAVARAALSSQRLRTLAREAGFSLCGFARAEPIPPEVLGDWLAAGCAADMDWMAARAAERQDPARLLPGVRSVMALACNYHWAEGSASTVASYARGRDYHATLRDRLRKLRKALEAEHPDVETYGSVDSNPVMEKVWAARAGLGYVGRNGCLITEGFGSYVVLAAVLLGAEVDEYADGPALDRCGGCRLCVTACPTDAIVADATVDARRCLSYQTIENAGHVPAELRPAFGGLTFGCDACQDVCPLNLHPVAADPRFQPRPVAGLSARELAALTPEDYARLVPGTALARAQYGGLRRNAAYALGAAKDAGARPLLERLAGDPDERVSEAARWALEQLPR